MRREKVVFAIMAIVIFASGCTDGNNLTGHAPESPTKGETGEDIEFYNLDSGKREKIESITKSFYQEVPTEKSERLNATAKIADEICNKNNTTISKEAFETSGEIKREAIRIKHAAETLENNFNSGIEPSRIQSVIDGAGKISRYTTVVGPYNQFVEDACEFEKDDPEKVEDFYVSSAALGAELAMMQYSVYYKTSYEVTRVAANSRTYRAVQSQLGDDALRILMSETHWAARGSLRGADQFATKKARELDINGEFNIDEEKLQQSLEKKYGATLSLIEEADMQEKLSCIKEAIDWKSAGKIPSIIKDGKVTEKEVEKLPQEVKDKFEGCLSSS